ncbi:nuclear transport factor 2 family protein [Chungangia koreensis]|uniref:Nuclear transport factor 2 family protein n=1 Tax=Chungangia koreensis TaxID=752657 RepID=A0ABV8X0W2_9LACT
MNLLKLLTISVFGLLLVACGNDDTNTLQSNSDAPQNAQSTLDHGVTNDSVGFNVTGKGSVEEATNVPKEEREAVIEVFNENLAAFNEEDIDRYMATIAKKPEGFKYDDEKMAVQTAFEKYDTKREASNHTIVKYSENEAQLFANIDISMSEPKSGATIDRSGRQVTVFVKEDGKWRISSVYFIGDTE